MTAALVAGVSIFQQAPPGRSVWAKTRVWRRSKLRGSCVRAHPYVLTNYSLDELSGFEERIAEVDKEKLIKICGERCKRSKWFRSWRTAGGTHRA